ncbi:MAG: DNA mismatch repair endonuclease MutL [Candidatus Woesearchaeota archaeon]
MDRISLLDDFLINKIAAGEVIERPASVVKELIENSLDANAKKIIIETKEGGKSLIKVSDNGIGMSERDALLSWQKHATSKIKTEMDLNEIKTFGFRGEALSSIAAVSELTIMTKEKEENKGIKIIVNDGKLITKEEIGMENGTIIEVKNLFFNVPARKKHLKSIETELNEIIDIVTRFALINKDVHFILLHNNKEIINSPATSNLLNKISFVYGSNVAKEIIEVNYTYNYDENKPNEKIQIYGYISLPSLTRSTKEEQSIFINNRYIKKNKIISQAIEDAYKTSVMINRYPIVILNISLPYEKTDVNVHPQKHEILIHDEATLYTAVYESVKKTLDENKKITEVKPTIKIEKLKNFLKQEEKKEIDKIREEDKYSDIDIEKKKEERKIEEETKIEKKSKKYYSLENNKQEILIKESNELNLKNLPDMNILGIINRTFIIAEIKGGLIIIDQHAAAERILYETFTKELKEKSIKIQDLLNPEIIQLSAKNYNTALSNKEFFDKIGYKIDSFGNNSIIIRSIPIILGRQLGKEMLVDFLTEMTKIIDIKEKDIKDLTSFEKFFHNKIARMSCRKAIKAGDIITLPQIKKYIQEISENYLPLTCPHGRPILIKFSIYDLEKMFKRIV